jgi:hypothetical protein
MEQVAVLVVADRVMYLLLILAVLELLDKDLVVELLLLVVEHLEYVLLLEVAVAQVVLASPVQAQLVVTVVLVFFLLQLDQT